MLRTNCQKLYDFLDKWYKLFKNEKSTVNQLLDKSFEEKCDEFGFYEDYERVCEEGLLSIEGISEFIENNDFDLDDAFSILYGRWNWYRYDELNKSDIKNPEVRRWFIKVLECMLMHVGSALNMGYGDIVSCRIKTIIYNTGYKKKDGIEETLIINKNGEIKRSLKKNGCKNYPDSFTVESNKAKDYIKRLSKCFVYGNDFYLDSRFGTVEIEFTNTENRKNRFFYGLGKLKDEEGNDLSKMLRELCDLDELLVFDGKLKLIEELILDYCSDNVFEKLIVKKEESSLTYIQDIDGRRMSITIDDQDIKLLFNHIKPDNFISGNTDSLRTFTVSLVLSDGQLLSYDNSYNARSLSDELVSFIEGVGRIIGHYNVGDIFKRSIYNNPKRKKGDYMLCKVSIDRLRKEYYYLSIEDDLCVYDDVIVPGIDNAERYIGTIEEIKFCKENKLPYPLNNMRYIERRCVNEDYEFIDELFY